jgi:hypothetical protein
VKRQPQLDTAASTPSGEDGVCMHVGRMAAR